MITVKVKIHNDKLEKFLTHLQTLDSDTIESIDYKLPKPKLPKKPKIIYKPYTFDNLVPFTDLVIKDGFILHNDKKVQTIQLIANYGTVTKMFERMGFKSVSTSKHSPVATTTKDKAIRYKVDEFQIKSEVVKLTKGKSVSSNMMITRNLPLLFDYATEHKKAKGSYCLLNITGLDEPKEKEAFNIILKFITRKTFKLYKIE